MNIKSFIEANARNHVKSITEDALHLIEITSKEFDQYDYRNDPIKGSLYCRFEESVIKKSVAKSGGEINVIHVINAIVETKILIESGCDKAELTREGL